MFYDELETIILKRFSNTLDYMPVESIFGTIQVKSKLTKVELRSALNNIHAFKALEPENLYQKVGGLNVSTGLHPRFGVIFAYEYDLDWASVIQEIEEFAAKNESYLLPNAVIILGKGYFYFGNDERGSVFQKDLQKFDKVKVYGFPDHSKSCLFAFYSILMELLDEAVAGPPQIDNYLRLPLTSGKYSYRYSHGAFSEVRECPKHGKFLKTISTENIEKIISYVKSCTPINWIRAHDLAIGNPGDDHERRALRLDSMAQRFDLSC